MSLWSVVRCDRCGASTAPRSTDSEASERAASLGWVLQEVSPAANLQGKGVIDLCVCCKDAPPEHDEAILACATRVCGHVATIGRPALPSGMKAHKAKPPPAATMEALRDTARPAVGQVVSDPDAYHTGGPSP